MIWTHKLHFLCLEDKWDWNGLQEFPVPDSWLKHCHQWGWIRSCRVLSGQSSKTSKDGDSTVSLSNLFHYLAVLMEREYFLISGQNLSFQLVSSVLSSCCSRIHFQQNSTTASSVSLFLPTLLFLCRIPWDSCWPISPVTFVWLSYPWEYWLAPSFHLQFGVISKKDKW